MIATLPPPMQRRAQARSLLVAVLNPLGSSITFGQVTCLLALLYGAGDTAMALIYASLSLTGLLALFAPRILAGQDTSTVQTQAWFVRGIASAGLLGLPLLASDAIKVWVLIGVIYLMSAARTVGMLANVAVSKAICSPRELGGFIGQVHARWNAGILITTVLCFAVLSAQHLFTTPEWAYMALLGFGVILNLATAWTMTGLPRTGTITGAGPWELLAGFGVAWRRPECREVLWLTLLQAPIALAAAFQLNYLTHVLGMNASTVFLLTLAGVMASLLATRVLTVVCGRISSRALWFGLHAVLAMVAILWCAVEVVPPEARSGACAVLWVLASAAIAGSGAIYVSMLSERLPAEDTTRMSVVYQLVGVLATILGLGALAAAKWGTGMMQAGWIHPYSHAFALWAVLSIGVCALSLRMAGGTATVDLLAQLTPGNLSTIFRAQRLSIAARDRGPMQALEREELLASGTPAGRDLVLETLHSPDSWDRLAALRAVRSAPFPAATAAVCAELADETSPWRTEAATTLGFLGDHAVVPQLRRLARDERDAGLAAAVSKSLSRLGAPLSDGDLLARYAAAPSPRERNDLLIALATAGRTAALDGLLVGAIGGRAPARWIETLALYAAQARNGREAMHRVLASEIDRPGTGLDEALALLAEHSGVEAAETVRARAAVGDWTGAATSFPIPVANRYELGVAVVLAALDAGRGGKT
jgi:hypothetical protein